MSFFTATQAALAEGERVLGAMLVEALFTSGTERFWLGSGTIQTTDSVEWSGMGEWIEVSGLQQAIGGAAPVATFKLSGAWPELVTIAKQSETEAKGNLIYVYGQFLTEEGLALDDKFVIWTGIMDQMRFVARGPRERVISLTAESLFTGRRRPAFGFYTDRDQQGRFSGDKGLEFVPALVNKTVTWPDF